MTGRLDRLKKVLIAGMVLAAKTQLRKKIVKEGWSQGISVEWVDLLADAPKKWCNGIARFTLLRWAVNQDDDVWLTLRGTRHKHLCGVCLKPGDTFPGGFYTEGWITTLHEMVATDSHIELGVEFPIRTWAMGCCSLSAQQVSLEIVLPLDYSTLLLPPLVGVCSMPVSQNAQVAVLPLQSPILSALRELERTGTNMESNVQLKLTRCSCGEYHMCITACRELIKGDVLVPDKEGDPKIIVQFDGSARESQVGGAGAALLQFDGNGVALLDWDARVLPKCADNIVAEANGADLAMHLYEKYVRMCHEHL